MGSDGVSVVLVNDFASLSGPLVIDSVFPSANIIEIMVTRDVG